MQQNLNTRIKIFELLILSESNNTREVYIIADFQVLGLFMAKKLDLSKKHPYVTRGCRC
jgi:hypothetical protein